MVLARKILLLEILDGPAISSIPRAFGDFHLEGF